MQPIRPFGPVGVVVEILPGINAQRIEEGERFQCLGQLAGVWHPGIGDEQRNDGDRAPDRRLDFDAHRIALIADSRLPAS